MQNKTDDVIALHVDGKKCDTWDGLMIDSDIGVPADAFRFEWFGDDSDVLPSEIKEGKLCDVKVNDETVLKGVIDSTPQRVSRGGVNTTISGRDLAGQMIDCSAPIDSARNLSLSQLIKRYVKGGDLANLPIIVGDVAQDWLKGKTGVNIAESVWDIIADAAQSSGQYVWMSANGELKIGNPFDVAQPARKPKFYLYSDDRRTQNNVIEADYQADISDVFSTVQVFGQTDKGKNFKATVTDERLAIKRTKVISDSRADTQAEAKRFAQKAMRDAWLNAYELAILVNGWTHQGQAWRTGWAVSFDSNVLPRAVGDWVIYGRTLELSRSEGKTTELRLRRKADWMQPVKYADLIKK